jgi:D-beta-D-heptose 7-phosphate kinase / D-beta-D-heptose 1-phosphate adenosyltransferase
MKGPIVVVGDSLLDIDLEGSVARICPDAPVPVVGDLVEHPRAGGAGLAATLAARDGAEVVLVTALSADDAGSRLRELLDEVEVVALAHDGPTPVKQRVRAAGQSLLRLDSGDRSGNVGPLPAGTEELLRSAAVVLVADYGRGLTGQARLREAIARLPHNVPVVWDPHPRGTRPVPAARLVCPNRDEAAVLAEREGVQAPSGLTGFARAGRQARGLVAAWQAQAVAITLGERGALLSYGTGSPVVTPAPRVPCVDVCGAGDRFAVTAALSLGAGAVTTEAVQNAVWAAADFVSGGGAGTVQRQPERTRAAGGTVVATGGCFDLLHAGHVATLRAARDLGDCLVVCLNSDESVRRLKGPGRPLVPASDRARVLAALEYVDEVVVFDEDTPVEVLRRIRPDVWAKGGDYALTDLEEATVLEEWGGQAVVLPYLQGRSTTQMVASARADR